jgi:methionine-rich copper-binding protein CopC
MRHERQRACRVGAVSAFLVGLLAISEPAVAHAMLNHAVPSAGSTIRQSLKSVSLSFSEALEPAFSKIAVTNLSGKDETAGAPTATGTSMEVALKPLPAGTYRVKWLALSVDTHRTSGTFQFTVVP